MGLIYVLFCVVQWIIGFNLVFPLLLLLIASLRTQNNYRKTVAAERPEADYAFIVTAYGQVDQVPAVLESIRQLDYNRYIVYVVADNCDASALRPADSRVVVLTPERVLAGNVKSHFYAINRFVRPHERLVIIDSDNLVDPGLLRELDVFFSAGFNAVQGVRKAKNLDTMYAGLDAARDLYYHFYDGEKLFEAGSSATLAGSGMAFTVDLYRGCLEGRDVSGAGFDKVLQAAIVSRDERIAFAGKAVVYDEKTTASDQLVKQRARWINTWFRYFGLGFGLVGSGLTGLSANRLLFGLVLLRPPLFIFLAGSLILAMVNVFISPTAVVLWVLGMLCFIAGFIWALIRGNADPRIIRSLYGIPAFVYYQVLALLRIGRANQISVATRQESESLSKKG